MDDQGALYTMPLWFVAYRVLDDKPVACCYICDWFSGSAHCRAQAVEWLNTHIQTEGHLLKVK